MSFTVPLTPFLSTALLAMTLVASPATAAARPAGAAHAAHAADAPPPLLSPDHRLRFTLSLTPQRGLQYSVHRNGRPVVLPSTLGLELQGAQWRDGLVLDGASAPRRVSEHYTLAVSKRLHHHHRANEATYAVKNAAGQPLQLVVRVADDGVAFRYVAAVPGPARHTLLAEHTHFRFAAHTRAWMQPMQVAKTGWKRSNPAYEEHYQIDVPVGTPSPLPAGWVFPALLRSGPDWVALSEADMDGSYHASRLAADAPGGDYRLAPPPPEEVFTGGALLADTEGPLRTPWRLLAIGSLKTVAESTLGTDLAPPPAVAFDPALVRPGPASWSWALLKDDATVEAVQRRFIDYAADMHWPYCLIDADWDRKIGYDTVQALAAYAASRGVGLMLWYNSAGDWNDTPYTPRDALLTSARRQAEFARLRAMGIKGVKVDFFGGDGVSMLQHYLGILRDAAAAGLLVNFHGATLPRGWQRTWPNLMTMEAVKGLEFTTFTQADQDAVPRHAAMLPFTRNLFDPMDFTPMVFGDIPNIQRRTRNGFELAETVLFTSGIQHLAETPEGMATVPEFVRAHLRALPRQWDESRFITGVPGQHVVMARRAGRQWQVAGLNAGDAPLTLRLDLGFLAGRQGVLITDGDDGPRSLVRRTLAGGRGRLLTLQPQGGFVAVFDR